MPAGRFIYRRNARPRSCASIFSRTIIGATGQAAERVTSDYFVDRGSDGCDRLDILFVNTRLLCFFCILFGICSSAVAEADVGAVQSALKDRGFYYGEIDGVWSDRTAAAVTRFQIRQGYEITGKLSPETLQALGVATDPADTDSRAVPAGTWQVLREKDEAFLENMPEGAGASQPPVEPSSASRRSPEFTTRERLRDYIAAFVVAGLDPDVNAELEFFADDVDYFGDQTKDKDQIRRDLLRYNRRYPQRSFWLAGDPEVIGKNGATLTVNFPLRFQVSGEEGSKSGKVLKTLKLREDGRQLEIISVNERAL